MSYQPASSMIYDEHAIDLLEASSCHIEELPRAQNVHGKRRQDCHPAQA